jgi:aspartate/methionine/tyrosine aminotransferase
MTFPDRFADLPEYAFPRLRRLLAGHEPGGPVIDMTIGEPRHPMPEFVGPVLSANLAEFAKYPPNDGTPELRAAIAGWMRRRHGLALDPDRQVMTVNGTREGLFNAAVALCPEIRAGRQPLVLIPNPFYQVYAVGARAAGAEPLLLPATAATGFLPDFGALDAATLSRTALVYLCSPSNPQGVVASEGYLADLVALAERYDFRILSDECYSELWRDLPPTGAAAVASRIGADPERVVTFQSLSKRSNLPGLRSGFAAGGAECIARMKQLRAYAGAPLPLPIQRVSEAAWNDEAHVDASRALYREKYAIADRVLGDVPGYRPPEAGFFLWLPVPDGEAAAVTIYDRTGVRVLPGAYLGRDTGEGNPGSGYIRVAMVAPPDEVADGLTRVRAALWGG